MTTYSSDEGQYLLDVAFRSIDQGLRGDMSDAVQSTDCPAALQSLRASFVTLHLNGTLRGCIGTLEAVRPLVEDVHTNAYAAAFRDPRFPPVEKIELDAIDISISVLSEPEPLSINSEKELLASLRPGIDGLILEDGYRRSTFLPAVWESLPAPGDFVRQLKLKAGLSADHWSPQLCVYRYHTEVIDKETIRELLNNDGI